MSKTTVTVPRREVVVRLDGDLAGGELAMGVPTAREFGAIRRGELDEGQVLELVAKYAYSSNLDVPVGDLDFITASSIVGPWFDALIEAAVPKTPAGS